MKAKILSKELLSKRWADYSEYQIEYERLDGNIEIQKREILNTGDGTAILLYNLEKREIVLIKQFRLASMIQGNETGIIYEVPAGLVENNDHYSTIIKEVKEETGYVIEKAEFLFQGYATPGVKTETIYFYAAPYNEGTLKLEGGGLLSEQEEIEIVHMTFDTAIEMVFDRTIMDLKTIALLLYAKKYLFN